MRPVLFKSSERDFSSNGIGVLTETVTCIVHEELNGSYELSMEYPENGLLSSLIGQRSIILAMVNRIDQTQPFRVYKIEKSLSGLMKIYARHISYDLAGVVVAPFTASGSDGVISSMLEKSTPKNHGFTLYTDINNGAGLVIDAPTSFRTLQKDGLLELFGGEFQYDRFKVSLLSSRGKASSLTIRYGYNMTSFEQEENCSDVYTAVYPYWLSDDNLVTLEEKIVQAAGSYDFVRILPLDLTSAFESKPTTEELKAVASNYIVKNNIGVPRVALRLSFEDMTDSKWIDAGLGDTVKVVFKDINVETTAKIVSVEFDSLAERYSSVDVGSSLSGISDIIAEQSFNIGEIKSKNLETAIANATSWLTKTTGGHIVFKRDKDGGFSEIFIMDTADVSTARKVWRMNLGGFGFSKNGINGPYEVAITQDGQIVADFITSGTMSADRIHGGKIDAESIDVINLNADNINSGSLNGERLADNSVSKNKATQSVRTSLGYGDYANDVFNGNAVAPVINAASLSGQNFSMGTTGGRSVYINGSPASAWKVKTTAGTEITVIGY